MFHTSVMQGQDREKEWKVRIKGSQLHLLRIMLLQHMQILHVYSSSVHSFYPPISLPWIALFLFSKTLLPWTLTIFCPKGPEKKDIFIHKKQILCKCTLTCHGGWDLFFLLVLFCSYCSGHHSKQRKAFLEYILNKNNNLGNPLSDLVPSY